MCVFESLCPFLVVRTTSDQKQRDDRGSTFQKNCRFLPPTQQIRNPRYPEWARWHAREAGRRAKLAPSRARFACRVNPYLFTAEALLRNSNVREILWLLLRGHSLNDLPIFELSKTSFAVVCASPNLHMLRNRPIIFKKFSFKIWSEDNICHRKFLRMASSQDLGGINYILQGIFFYITIIFLWMSGVFELRLFSTFSDLASNR